MPDIFFETQAAPEHAGKRLDDVLRLVLPGASVRMLRRLWKEYRVLCDGRPAKANYCLRGAEHIVIIPRSAVPGAAFDTAFRAGTNITPDTAFEVTPDIAPDVVPDVAPDATSSTMAGNAPGLAALAHLAEMPALLHLANGFAALYKPAGLHSARLSGGAQPNMENLLPDLLLDLQSDMPPNLQPDTPPDSPTDQPGNWLLLNRLDRETSGILLAGNGPIARESFLDAENAGRVFKEYYAVVHGHFAEPVTLTARLHTANTPLTKVLEEFEPDSLRHTRVEPLCAVQPNASITGFTYAGQDSAFSLVRCRIKKGRRHQIRAHLAHAGHAILGDPLYGPQSSPHSPQHGAHEGGIRLFLHHFRITLPDFCAECPPGWLPTAE